MFSLGFSWESPGNAYVKVGLYRQGMHMLRWVCIDTTVPLLRHSCSWDRSSIAHSSFELTMPKMTLKFPFSYLYLLSARITTHTTQLFTYKSDPHSYMTRLYWWSHLSSHGSFSLQILLCLFSLYSIRYLYSYIWMRPKHTRLYSFDSSMYGKHRQK